MNPTPATPPVSGVSSFCEGNDHKLSCAGRTRPYLWNTGATTQTITIINGGTYNVTVSNGSCTATSLTK